MKSREQVLEPMIDMGFTPERFPLGTHMCYVYNDEDERREVMAQYINTGIAIGEFVGYFADVDTEDLVEDYLAQMGIQIPRNLQTDRTLFKPAREVYCPGNHFTPDGMLTQLKQMHHHCHTHGIGDLRVTGEMSWALSPKITGAERLVEYESRLNILMETHPMTAICQYDANTFEGATIFEILKVHPMMVVRGQVVRNPYYVPAREYLSSKGLSLEG